jgi:hypothetical protein
MFRTPWQSTSTMAATDLPQELNISIAISESLHMAHQNAVKGS